ncbi:MAG TPA: ABC transporter ATP-binding protein [bacterium]
MNDAPAVVARGLWKRYAFAGPATIARKVWDLIRPNRRPEPDSFWALRDVSFEVRPGECLGIIGDNGAGKTTLLRILCGVTRQTRGTVATVGRIIPLIELGAGFHPELTGRENVFLNAILLGMTRREAAAQFDRIVEFSGLHEFIDMPVKRYSSGMYARLGFSVAAFFDPEVLLIDEVLSVGDLAFANRAYRHMAKVARSAAVVFVSHNLGAVTSICTRALWLRAGAVQQVGDPDQIVRAYVDATMQGVARDGERPGAVLDLRDPEFDVRRVELLDRSGAPSGAFQSGDDIRVAIAYWSARGRHAFFQVLIRSPVTNTSVSTASMLVDGEPVWLDAGEGSIECVFKTLPLQPGAYVVGVTVFPETGYLGLLGKGYQVARFTVSLPGDEERGGFRDYYNLLGTLGPVRAAYEWKRPEPPSRAG